MNINECIAACAKSRIIRGTNKQNVIQEMIDCYQSRIERAAAGTFDDFKSKDSRNLDKYGYSFRDDMESYLRGAITEKSFNVSRSNFIYHCTIFLDGLKKFDEITLKRYLPSWY